MSGDQSGETASKWPLTTAGVVIRLGAIGVAVLTVVGAFAYTGGLAFAPPADRRPDVGGFHGR